MGAIFKIFRPAVLIAAALQLLASSAFGERRTLPVDLIPTVDGDGNTFLLVPAQVDKIKDAPPGVRPELWNQIRIQQGVITFAQYVELKTSFMAGQAQPQPPTPNPDLPPTPAPPTPNPDPTDLPPTPVPVTPTPTPSVTATVTPTPTPTAPPTSAGRPTPTPGAPSAFGPEGPGSPGGDSASSNPRSEAPRDPFTDALNRAEDKPQPVPSNAGVPPADMAPARAGHELPPVENPFPVARFFRRGPDATPVPPSGAERWKNVQSDRMNKAVDDIQQALQDPTLSDRDIAKLMEAMLRLGRQNGVLEDGDPRLSDVTKIIVKMLADPLSVDAPAGSGASNAGESDPPPFVEPPVPGKDGTVEGTATEESERRAGGRLPTELAEAQPWLPPPKNKSGGLSGLLKGAGGGSSSSAVGPQTNSKLRAVSHSLIRDLAATLKAQRRLGFGSSQMASKARRAVAGVSPLLSGFMFPGDPDDPSLWPFLAGVGLVTAAGIFLVLQRRKRQQRRSHG